MQVSETLSGPILRLTNEPAQNNPYLGPAGTSLLDSAHSVRSQIGTMGTLHWKGCL